MPEDGPRLGFLGAGRMATALARAWTASGRINTSLVLASDPLAVARETFASETGCSVTDSNRRVVSHADLLVLAVKPQTMSELLSEVRDLVQAPNPLSSPSPPASRWGNSARGWAAACRLVRVMPNTPCLVGASASGFSPGEHATADDVALVQRLLDDAGRAIRVPEKLLDAVTGLSGSGPAFVYLIIEALSDGGVRVGLPRDVATILAAQTVLGIGENGPGNRAASRRAQGRRRQPRRHHHRRAARAGAGRRPRGPHGRRRGRHATGGRNWGNGSGALRSTHDTIPSNERILILDFGAQYGQLIARRVREQNVFCQIVRHDLPASRIAELNPRGLILSGGPASVYDPALRTAIPRSSIWAFPSWASATACSSPARCWAARSSPAASREFGRAVCPHPRDQRPVRRRPTRDRRVDEPRRSGASRPTATSFRWPPPTPAPSPPSGIAARPIYGLQFHPEVSHTPQGVAILRNFLYEVCGCQGLWKIGSFLDQTVARPAPAHRRSTASSAGCRAASIRRSRRRC